MQTYSLLFYAKKTKGNSEMSTIYMRIEYKSEYQSTCEKRLYY